jgi:hypothetical protein
MFRLTLLPLTFDVSFSKLQSGFSPGRLSLEGDSDMTKVDIFQGTLDMLILMTLSHDPMHGSYTRLTEAIAKVLQTA